MNVSRCKICKKIQDTRLGVCFDCAECESIIVDGTDMHGKIVAKTSLEKLLQVAMRLL